MVTFNSIVTVVNFEKAFTLISLINVEVGINVEGGAKVAKSLNVEIGINEEDGIFGKN